MSHFEEGIPTVSVPFDLLILSDLMPKKGSIERRTSSEVGAVWQDRSAVTQSNKVNKRQSQGVPLDHESMVRSSSFSSQVTNLSKEGVV